METVKLCILALMGMFRPVVLVIHMKAKVQDFPAEYCADVKLTLEVS